jgi:hypothetical protein
MLIYVANCFDFDKLNLNRNAYFIWLILSRLLELDWHLLSVYLDIIAQVEAKYTYRSKEEKNKQ